MSDYLRQPIDECLVLVFVFKNDGRILAYNPSEKRFHTDMRIEVIDWVRALERVYSELRCWSSEELSRRVAAGKRE